MLYNLVQTCASVYQITKFKDLHHWTMGLQVKTHNTSPYISQWWFIHNKHMIQFPKSCLKYCVTHTSFCESCFEKIGLVCVV